jgi:23S rRNA-/tRNA-specific pseudouridylate synthase
VRAHLAHAGHPVVGDLLYGGDERDFVRLQLGQRVDTPPGLAPGRHLLHAWRLRFTGPAATPFEAEAPWPVDLRAGAGR